MIFDLLAETEVCILYNITYKIHKYVFFSVEL